MNKPELLYQLRQRLATTSAEAPYCIMPRSLLLETITAIDERSRIDDPLVIAIEAITTRKEFLLLCCLDKAGGRTVLTADLIAAADLPTKGDLWAHLSRLRKKLATRNWGDIAIIRGKGYAWHRPADSAPV